MSAPAAKSPVCRWEGFTFPSEHGICRYLPITTFSPYSKVEINSVTISGETSPSRPLTPPELAELEKLATPPSDAPGCLIVHYNDDASVADAVLSDYIVEHGHMPPIVMNVHFVAAGGDEASR